MTKTYDAMPIVDKVTVDIANHSGFYGSKIFILDQYNQYDLHTQEWLPLENNGRFGWFILLRYLISNIYYIQFLQFCWRQGTWMRLSFQ